MLRIIFLLLLLPNFAFGSAGEIGKFSGSGVLERDSQVIDGGRGVGVMPMDTAVTARGRMRIDFIDETRVDITEHARLLIDDFVYDPNTRTGSLGLRATLGTVRYASGQIAKNSRQRVNIRTPSAKINVRGTDFVMIVDEIGGTMVTLLPSCDISGYCVTGEITVENDNGIVIMNQSYQTTIVKQSWTPPLKPLILNLEESDITNLLILRKKTPYIEEEEEILHKSRKLYDFLDIDFLEYDGLDEDALVDDIKNIWATELNNTDMYLQELLHDMLDTMNLALAALFKDELQKQNEEFFADKVFGYDPSTRITLGVEEPNWKFSREDASIAHYIDLELNQEYGYTINLEQQDEAIYDYRLGVGNNTINIIQVQ